MACFLALSGVEFGKVKDGTRCAAGVGSRLNGVIRADLSDQQLGRTSVARRSSRWTAASPSKPGTRTSESVRRAARNRLESRPTGSLTLGGRSVGRGCLPDSGWANQAGGLGDACRPGSAGCQRAVQVSVPWSHRRTGSRRCGLIPL